MPEPTPMTDEELEEKIAERDTNAAAIVTAETRRKDAMSQYKTWRDEYDVRVAAVATAKTAFTTVDNQIKAEQQRRANL